MGTPNFNQWNRLLDILEGDREMRTGQFMGANGRERLPKKWEAAAKELNELCSEVSGGAIKTGQQWKDALGNLKSRARKAHAIKKQYVQGTGGGPRRGDEDYGINEIYKRCIELVGIVTATGRISVPNPLEIQQQKRLPIEDYGPYKRVERPAYFSPSRTSPPAKIHSNRRENFARKSPHESLSSSMNDAYHYSPRRFYDYSPGTSSHRRGMTERGLRTPHATGTRSPRTFLSTPRTFLSTPRTPARQLQFRNDASVAKSPDWSELGVESLPSAKNLSAQDISALSDSLHALSASVRCLRIDVDKLKEAVENNTDKLTKNTEAIELVTQL